MTKCFRRRLARKCTEDDVNGITDFVSLITAAAVNLVCNDLDEDSDKCDRFTSPKKPKGAIRPKSFMFPLIDVLKSLPE